MSVPAVSELAGMLMVVLPPNEIAEPVNPLLVSMLKTTFELLALIVFCGLTAVIPAEPKKTLPVPVGTTVTSAGVFPAMGLSGAAPT